MAYRHQRAQGLTDASKATRLLRCKEILKRIATDRNSFLVFSDERKFTVSQSINAQNDRVYARNIQDAHKKGRHVDRRQSDQSAMVWLAVCEEGKSDIIFVPPGVKIDSRSYVSDILEKG